MFFLGLPGLCTVDIDIGGSRFVVGSVPSQSSMARRLHLALLAGLVAVALLVTLAGVIREGSIPSGLLTVAGVYLGSFNQLDVGDAAPDFPKGDVQWLNTEGSLHGAPRGDALSIRDLRKQGKIVLLHFWDYTSLRSSMAMPALRRWQERYADFGVQIIGVHRSRFHFASRLVHVARAVERLGLRHAIVNDEHGDISRAYGSKTSPTMFLIGTDGRIQYVEIGLEGMEDVEYQMCLAAAENHPNMWCGEEGLRGRREDISLSKSKANKSIFSSLSESWIVWIRWRISRYACMHKTADVMLGTSAAAHGQPTSLTNLQSYGGEGVASSYSDLSGVALGEGKFVLSGEWASDTQGVISRAGPKSGMENAHLRIRYHGKGVYALMGLEGTEHSPHRMCTDGKSGHSLAGSRCLHVPFGGECRDVGGVRGFEGWCETSGGQWGGCMRCGKPIEPQRVWVLIDGAPIPHEVRGSDVEEDALGRTLVTVREPRIYAIVGGVAAGDRSVTLLPEAPGLVVHQFSFTAECGQQPPKSIARAPPVVRRATKLQE